MYTFRILTPLLLQVPMEAGIAEVTSIARLATAVRAETTLPSLAVRRERRRRETEPARRIVRPMRILRWQTAVRARWALPPRFIRRRAPDQPANPTRRRIVRLMRILRWQTAAQARWVLPPRFIRRQ